MRKLFAIGMALLILTWCASCMSVGGDKVKPDGYVPWWVEDGVPNADGIIVK